MKILNSIVIAAVVAIGFVASEAQAKRGKAPAFAELQRKGFVAADVAKIDMATKLPRALFIRRAASALF